MTGPDWAAAQTAMARLSANSELIVAEGSGHAVHLDKPGIVIHAVLSVLGSARSTN